MDITPRPTIPSHRPDWAVVRRTGAAVSTIAGLSAYLLARAGFAERSVVLAVIVVVSSLAWAGVLDRRPPAPLLRLRVPSRDRHRPMRLR